MCLRVWLGKPMQCLKETSLRSHPHPHTFSPGWAEALSGLVNKTRREPRSASVSADFLSHRTQSQTSISLTCKLHIVYSFKPSPFGKALPPVSTLSYMYAWGVQYERAALVVLCAACGRKAHAKAQGTWDIYFPHSSHVTAPGYHECSARPRSKRPARRRRQVGRHELSRSRRGV